MHKANQEEQKKNGLFSVIRKDFFSIPVSIRIISLSMFLFILGWGLGGDTFFSLYIKSIVDNVFRISVIASLLPLIKMFFSVSVGELEDHSDIRSIIFLSKAIYICTSIFFFIAGIEHSIVFLIVAVLFNGLGTGSLITSYESLIRKYGKQKTTSTVFGLYFSSYNAAYVVGALIAAFLIQYVQLPYLYLFVGLFAGISFLSDKKLPNLSKRKIKAFLGKESFLHQFFREAFSFSAIKKAYLSLKQADKKLHRALRFEFLFNVLNYIGFIFIPIVSVQNHLSLSQVAIIFAMMRLPYVVDFFTGEFADRYSKRRFILVVLFFLSFLFALLGFKDNFGSIMTISLGISVGLSLIRPVVSGYVSDFTDNKSRGMITGIQEFTGNFGAMFGSLFFGILTSVIGMSASFILVGVLLFLFAGISLGQRYYAYRKNR